MQRWLLEGRIAAPDPDLASEQYDLACARLAAEGWEHYEISNWARPGRACRHNLTYWRNEPYLGLGAGAHGYAGSTRYENVKQPRTYYMAGRKQWRPVSAIRGSGCRPPRERRRSDERHGDLETRPRGGLDVTLCPALSAACARSTARRLSSWKVGGCQERDGRLLLTEQGWFLSNQVFYRFL